MNNRNIALLSGTAATLVASLSAMPALSADDNPFQMSEVQRPAVANQKLAQGRCGGGWEGRCGGSREGRCGGSWNGRRGGGSQQGGMMGQSMARHRMAMMGGIPAAYRRLSNPLPATPEVLAQGERIYSANCVTCHGQSGAGDGPAGAGLSPPPADLRGLVRMPTASDGYLMWTISEGGADLGTAMPAFKATLGKGERWQIVHYLRTLG